MLKIYPVKKNITKTITIGLAAIFAIVMLNLDNAVEVRTEPVKKGNMKELVELQGRVELEKSEKVYSKLEGFVDEIYADEGSEVEAGKVLLQLSAEDIEYAISKAKADYNASVNQLENLKSSIKPEHVRLSEAQLEQTVAAEKAAAQDYRNKRDNYEREKTL
jgi:multidrug efflux pump subunit AcrA (membrane-fusion protein)